MNKIYDCTDIDLRMQFALDGGLTEDEKGLFFGHLAGCADCRLVYLSMALTEAADAETEAAGAQTAHAIDPTDIEPRAQRWPEHRGWRGSSWLLASVAVVALVIGALGGGTLGAREPERQLVLAAAASTQQEARIRGLESQAKMQTEQLEKLGADLEKAQQAQPPDTEQLAARLEAANQRMAELETIADELRQENATMRSKLAKARAGAGAVLTPGAVCKAGSTHMEFEPREKWASCGKPSSAAYRDKTNEQVYWTVKAGDDMMSCVCEAAGK